MICFNSGLFEHINNNLDNELKEEYGIELSIKENSNPGVAKTNIGSLDNAIVDYARVATFKVNEKEFKVNIKVLSTDNTIWLQKLVVDGQNLRKRLRT